jgi:uncharacterized membrane protein HdeD (DUF308 family)
LKQQYSATIGIVGGLIDIIAGIVLLQTQTSMMADNMSSLFIGLVLGYFLLALGMVVLVTGLYLLPAKMMKGLLFGRLMLIYGVIMLVLGVGMLGRLLPLMQGSVLSGVAMLVIGTAMLYSGFDMAKK